jgi:hypothetical protein
MFCIMQYLICDSKNQFNTDNIFPSEISKLPVVINNYCNFLRRHKNDAVPCGSDLAPQQWLQHVMQFIDGTVKISKKTIFLVKGTPSQEYEPMAF